MDFNAYKKVSKIIFTLSLVTLVSACGNGGSSGGGGGGDAPGGGGGGGAASIANSVAQAQAAMIDSDSSADLGSYGNSYTFAGKRYSVLHKRQGHAFCQPTDLYVVPNPVIATGPTTRYGCDNNFTLTYQLINPTTVKVTLTAPILYIDLTGSLKVNNVAVGGAFDAYIILTNYVFTQEYPLVDNGNATFSFGTGNFASLVFTYDTRSAQSNDPAVDPHFTSGAMEFVLETQTFGMRFPILNQLLIDLQNADDFPAP